MLSRYLFFVAGIDVLTVQALSLNTPPGGQPYVTNTVAGALIEVEQTPFTASTPLRQDSVFTAAADTVVE